MSFPRTRETIAECLANIQETSSPDLQLKSLQTLVTITKVSPQNRNMLGQTDGAIPCLFSLSKSSSQSVQTLALSILFNLSLNQNLKQSLADMQNIEFLNTAILSSGSAEYSKLAASLLCSLAMLDKNKAKFGVAGTVQALLTSISDVGFYNQASQHLLSSLAELMQFHGNCTLAVRLGAVPMLIKVVESHEGEDHASISPAVLCLLSRFEEGLFALRDNEKTVELLIEVLKGRCMFSKEGAAEILVRLFDGSEDCLRDALRSNELSSVLADLSVRGSARAREKATSLMKKIVIVEANLEAYADGDHMVY